MLQTTLRLGTLATALILGGNAFAVDPQLMNLVMPDAKVLAGANVTSTISSPLGQFLFTKLTASGQFPFQKFTAATGFNPLQDITEILAASAGNPSSPGGLVLLRGNFPVDQITTFINTKGAGAQISTYGGATLISLPNAEGQIAAAAAFFGNSIAIAGDSASVKAAIDRSTGTNSIDPALAVTVNQLSGSEDEWVASSASPGSLLPSQLTSSAPSTGPAAQVLPLLNNIQAFNGGIKFGDNVALTGAAVMNSAQNAAALNAVIKLGMVLVGSSAPGANQQFAGLLQALQSMQVTTNGSEVDVSLSVPESQIESVANAHPVIASVRQSPLANGNGK